MFAKQDVIEQHIAAIWESCEPERVNPYGLNDDSLFYRWYIQLENGTVFCLHSDGIEPLSNIEEPVRKPRISATKWISGKEHFSRGVWTSEALRDQYIRATPFVREYTVLNEQDSERRVVGQRITAVLVASWGFDDRHVQLVLNGCAYLSVWACEDGNELQFDALDEQVDSRFGAYSKQTWCCLFDGTACDMLGRQLTTQSR